MPKTVYIGMTADIVHDGHISIVEVGRRYGAVTIGLLTDEALIESRRMPRLEYSHRKRILENVAGVKRVVPQNEWDYSINLRTLRPDFMIHGDDWASAPMTAHRDRALATMAEWGGQIVEIPCVEALRSRRSDERVPAFGTTPTIRLRRLREQIAASRFVRALEVHSPLCGLIVESTIAERQGKRLCFDAMWSSSLTDSAVRGKPDIEALDHSVRFAAINELFEVTTKPLLYDADTGGRPEHFAYKVRSLERMGVSAAILEDKKGLKKNSLLGTNVLQEQEEIEEFCEKIRAGKAAQVTDDFAIIGRIESLIAGAGVDDALLRARAYVAAGADGIMIHSHRNSPAEVFEFCERFRRHDTQTIVVAVPTSYNTVDEQELAERGVNVVIYANHLLRASYPAMKQVARIILEHGRAQESDPFCMSVDEILRLIPGTI